MRPELAAVPFQEPEKAEGNLTRLGHQLAPALEVPLASLLGQSPDPEGALDIVERYVEAAPRDS